MKPIDWIKQAYRTQRSSMYVNLAANVVALGAATLTTKVATLLSSSDIATTSASTAMDVAVFWSSFSAMSWYVDRKKKNVGSNPKKQISVYAGIALLFETSYAPLRFATQYALQKEGVDPTFATIVSQGVLVTGYTATLPIVKQGLEQVLKNKTQVK